MLIKTGSFFTILHFEMGLFWWNVTIIASGLNLRDQCISKFLDFCQDIRALPEARLGTDPAGEISVGLHE